VTLYALSLHIANHGCMPASRAAMAAWASKYSAERRDIPLFHKTYSCISSEDKQPALLSTARVISSGVTSRGKRTFLECARLRPG
jgi:hypothetical protein